MIDSHIERVFMNNKFTVAGFFSGTGGIELGLQESGFETVYSNDFDKFAHETRTLNSPGHIQILDDINEVDPDSVPSTTLIAGGFPCQAFSVAGYRQGFHDDRGRGNLFFRLMKFVENNSPEVVLLENVKGLVGHDKGNTFKIILDTLEGLGYYVKWSVLNAKDFGNVPQGRERIYIVGFKNADHALAFNFPAQITRTTNVRDLVDFDNKVEDKYYYTQAKYPRIWDQLKESIIEEEVFYQWRRQYVRQNKSGVAPTLTANMGTGGHNVPLIFTKYGIRKLTPRECFNLMGYPHDFKLPVQADSHLYKQAGNAVVVSVVQRIGLEIKKALTSTKTSEEFVSTSDSTD